MYRRLKSRALQAFNIFFEAFRFYRPSRRREVIETKKPEQSENKDIRILMISDCSGLSQYLRSITVITVHLQDSSYEQQRLVTPTRVPE